MLNTITEKRVSQVTCYLTDSEFAKLKEATDEMSLALGEECTVSSMIRRITVRSLRDSKAKWKVIGQILNDPA